MMGASGLEVPSGSQSVDVLLMDRANGNTFINKMDWEGQPLHYYEEGCVRNTRQAVVDIDDMKSGTIYLGLKNPSTWDGIDVYLEVVAIVEEITDDLDAKNDATTIGNLGWKAFERGDYNKCIELSKKAIKISPDMAFLYFNAGIAYLALGNNDAALTMYTKALTVSRKTVSHKENLEGAVEDLTTYMRFISSKNDAKDILDLLKAELQELD